nr:MAG TPA: hypothetical protein [Caudoviricetes sp.]
MVRISPAAGLSGRYDIATCDVTTFHGSGMSLGLIFFDGGKHYE